MKITDDIHALRIPFNLEIAPGKTINRFTYSYLIFSKNICLIDCGISSSKDIIFDYIRKIGRTPDEIEIAVLTHSHPDHIGGAFSIKKAVGCKIAAHSAAVKWIENVSHQFSERPVPSFYSIVEDSVGVDIVLRDNELLDFGNKSLKVIHTPGHSKGHISLFNIPDKALFSGNCIPLPGTIPIYEDIISSVKSVKILEEIQRIDVLLSSWDEPRYADSIPDIFNKSLEFFQKVHNSVLKAMDTVYSTDIGNIANKVIEDLGLPAFAMNPLFFKSIESHIRHRNCKNISDI